MVPLFVPQLAAAARLLGGQGAVDQGMRLRSIHFFICLGNVILFNNINEMFPIFSSKGLRKFFNILFHWELVVYYSEQTTAVYLKQLINLNNLFNVII